MNKLLEMATSVNANVRMPFCVEILLQTDGVEGRMLVEKGEGKGLEVIGGWR